MCSAFTEFGDRFAVGHQRLEQVLVAVFPVVVEQQTRRGVVIFVKCP